MTLRALLLASVFAWPLAARAQTVPYPTGIPSGGALLQNATSSALPARMITWGTGFAQGAMPSGSGLTGTVAGSAVTVQMDVLSTWADGSARTAAVTLLQPALAVGTAPAVTLARASSPAASTYAWPNPAVVVSGLSSGTSVTLTSVLASSTDTWLSGPNAVQRRADVPVPGDASGAMHLVADVTCYADGTVVVDVQFRRDLATVVAATNSGAKPVQLAYLAPYTPVVTVNGVATTLGTASYHNQYQDWHAVVGGPAVNVQHDVAGLIAAGLVPPYDLTLGVSAAAGSVYAQTVAGLAGGWGTPLTLNGVLGGMETSGGRPDIGITTSVNAEWLMTQDAKAAQGALDQADTGGMIPWHEWDAGAQRWLDAIDHPQLWTDARSSVGSYSDFLANPVPAQDTTNNPSTEPFDIAVTHMPNLDYVPAILTGSRYYRDLQAAQAMGAISFDYVPQRQPPGASNTDVVFGPTGEGSIEVRGVAWLLRELEEAAALATPGSTMAAHYQQMLADNWAWFNGTSANAPAALTTAQGQIGPLLENRTGGSGTIPGNAAYWQHDYLLSVFALGAHLGDTPAGAALTVMLPARVQSALPHAGWNRRNALSAETWTGSPQVTATPAQGSTAVGPQVTTWGDLQDAQVRNGFDMDSGFANAQGDYASLLRETLVWYLGLHPGDAASTAALTWLLGSGAPYMDAATYQKSQAMEALALPSGISSAGTASATDAGGYGNAGSTTDPGYYTASSNSGTGSSTGTTTSSTGTNCFALGGIIRHGVINSDGSITVGIDGDLRVLPNVNGLFNVPVSGGLSTTGSLVPCP